MTTIIESKHNPALRHLARLLREKKIPAKYREFACEGEKLLYEALASGMEVKTILLRANTAFNSFAQGLIAQAEMQGARLFETNESLFQVVSDVETPQGILFSCTQKQPQPLPAMVSNAMLLDGIQDPGNLGTILRTADAFALDAVILCEGCTDPMAPKAVRATMGAAFRQPLYRMPIENAIIELKTRGLPVYAAALEAESIPATTLDLHHAAIIVGNEGHGVSKQALALCDEKIIIPMGGRAESLNAGVAAAILIWEMTRRTAI